MDCLDAVSIRDDAVAAGCAPAGSNAIAAGLQATSKYCFSRAVVMGVSRLQ